MKATAIVPVNAPSKPAALSTRRDDILQRARALTPALASRALETEEKRQVPQATLDAFREAGLFRMMAPARVGGLELDFPTLLETTAQLARGCASSAWVLANIVSHSWMLGMWPKEAQDEIWGPDGKDARVDTRIAGSLIFPAGHAEAVEGGYRLSGKWAYASGVDACSWSMLGGTVEGDDDNSGEYRIFLLPRDDYSVNDNWFAAGLVGTATKEIRTDNAFVPAHRTVALRDTQGGPTPGSAVNPAPLYRVPVVATAGHVVVGVVLGTAEGALEHFEIEDRNRTSFYSGRAIKDYGSVQMAFSEASANAEAARRLLVANSDEIMQLAARSAAPSVREKARLRRDGAFATRLAVQSVDLMFTAMGGGALFLNHPLQRAFRDIHAAAAHIALNWVRAAQYYGKAALGQITDIPPHER
jgi:3-hydroxy-9,10-secoandrosta-1,3,5(10)-triene-9,17-dione monooxygenase